MLRGALLRAVVVLLVLCAFPSWGWADNRRDAKRHFQRGMALIEKGQVDRGVAELEQAYTLKPHPNVLFNMARAYDLANRKTEAVRAYERYLETYPQDPARAGDRLATLRTELAAARPSPAQPPTQPPPLMAETPPRGPAQPGDANAATAAALRRAAAAWEERAQDLERNTAPVAAPPLVETPQTAPSAAPAVTAGENALVLGLFGPPPPAELSGTEDVYERTVLSASRTGRSAVFAPASVTVLTDEDIRTAGARTIPDLLRRVAGVDVVAMSASDQNVSIRGFNQRISNRVLVLVDGVSVYQDYLGATFWNALPFNLEDIERIEVIRGPGAALYGANAVVGIINIITRRPGEGPAFQARITGGYPGLLDLGARGSLSRGMLAVSGSAGYVRARKWALEVTPTRRDVVPSFEDIPFDLSSDTARAQITSTLKPTGWLTLTGRAGITRNRQEVYAIGALRNFYVDGWLAMLSLEAEAGPLRVRTFYNGSRLRAGAQVKPVGSANPVGQVTSDVVDAEGTYTTRFNLLGEHRVVAGLSYRLKMVDWSLLSGAQLEHHAGAFAEDTWIGPGGHRLVVSGRLDRHPLVGLVPSARGAFVFKTGASSAVRAVLGTAFRNPTFLESYLAATPVSTVPGISIRSLGNRGLRPEQNIMAEVGYSAEIGDTFNVELAVYYGRLRGLILQGPIQRPGGNTYDPATGTFIAGESRFINDQEVFSQVGGEGSLSFNPLDGVDLYANYAFLRVLQEKANTFYVQTPAHKLNLGGRVRAPLGFTLSSDLHAVSSAVWSERSFDAAAPGGVAVQALRVPPYLLMTMRAAWRTPKDALEIFVQSDNLLGVLPYDVDRRLEGSALQAVSPALAPVTAHREHPFGNPSPARFYAGISAQL